MILNCKQCYRCCTHFTKATMAPFLQEQESLSIGNGYFYKVEMCETAEKITVMKRKNNRCIAWSYEEHCTIYSSRPLDCRLYPFTVKDDNMIIHLTCPDAVRLLNLLDAGDVEAERFYINAKDIILNASEKYLRYLEFHTRSLRFYCVVK